MQMILAKEKINLFMKGQDADLDEIYDRFGVDYDLLSLLMRREADDKGKFHIRWGEQMIS
jgi:N-6 DNA methylase family protein